MYGREKIMTWVQRIILPYVYPTKFSEATPKQTAEAQDRMKTTGANAKQTGCVHIRWYLHTALH